MPVTDGFDDALAVDTFGGLVTQADRNDLPPGVSPNCQDVEFSPGMVRSRGGFRNYLTTNTLGNPSYIKAAIRDDFAKTETSLVLADDGGTLGAKLYANGTSVDAELGYAYAIATVALASTVTNGRKRLCGHSATFGQFEAIALSDGRFGMSQPRKYDLIGGQFEQFAPQGPGIGPTLAAGAAGTVDNGSHYATVVFETRHGYRTDAPLGIFVANIVVVLNQKIVCNNIPLGPPGTIRRIIFFTPVGGDSLAGPYFALNDSVTSTFINDNTTTTATFDFTDIHLVSGIPLLPLVNQIEMPPVAGFCRYRDRLVGWGALTDTTLYINPGFTVRNLSFDGGLVGTTPGGWGAPAADGSVVTAAGAAGQVYQIAPTAVGARGAIVSLGLIDPTIFGNNVTILARVRRSAGMAAGTLRITAFGSTKTFSVAAAGFSTRWCLIGFTWTNTTTPTSLTLDLNNATTGGEYVQIDALYAQRLGDVTNPTDVLISRAGLPESIDPLQGVVSLGSEDGQAIRCCFEFRDNLYIFKERSFWVTRDTGYNEPADWNLELVSGNIGTPSRYGVARGEDWLVIVSQTGLYLFSGGQPEKISQEIQPTWDAVAWAVAGEYAWATVDITNRRVLVGVPHSTTTTAAFTNGSTAVTGTGFSVNWQGAILTLPAEPLVTYTIVDATTTTLTLDRVFSPANGNYSVVITALDKLLVMDYTNGFGNPLDSGGNGRAWTIWNVSTSVGTVRDPTSTPYYDIGVPQVLVGLNDGTGRVQNYDGTTTSDQASGGGNTAITSFYETAPLGRQSGRSAYGFLSANARGSGTLASSITYPNDSNVALRNQTLADPALHDLEWQLNAIATRLGFRFGVTGSTTAYFKLKRCVPYTQPAPHSTFRGMA